jgi:hypothetical protein
MPSATRSAGTGANDASFGTAAWTTPTNITASDDARATQSLAAGATTQYLKASSFGFTIPSGATIDGIVVEAEEFGGTGVVEARARIVKADATIGTTDKSTGAALPTSDTYRSYGGTTDLWGETWSATAINDSDFGFVFAATNGAGVSRTVSVDHVRITVHYTETTSSLVMMP